MTLRTEDQVVGVIGAGRFGTAIASLLSKNIDVLIYTRSNETCQSINESHYHPTLNYNLNQSISSTSDIEEICRKCRIIFPVIPSQYFRSTIKEFNRYLTPAHFLIHGTKGFDVDPILLEKNPPKLDRKEVFTMSEIIEQESQVVRIGCISGPNLSEEIMQDQPTATVIASRYQEVIDIGKRVLKSDKLRVFESFEIRGAELAGAFKNIIAIGAGILYGRGYGKNIQAMIITKGLAEIIYLGKSLGLDPSIFLGTAGLGDLIATATSNKSRNFSFGIKLGHGETLESTLENQTDLAEGIRTIKIVHGLQTHYQLKLPIISLLYRIIYEGYDQDEAMKFLMNFPYDKDVDFL